MRVRPCLAELAAMDWGYISTAVVGLAGIFGTLWQGKRSREAQTADLKKSLDAATENLKLGIDADSKHSRDAEKRRVYAQCLASYDDLLDASMTLKSSLSMSDPARLDAAKARLDQATVAMNRAKSEVRLITSMKIYLLADDLAARIIGYVTEAQEGESHDVPSREIAAIRRDLILAMRADLGEPALDA
jgi:hypothetical protein